MIGHPWNVSLAKAQVSPTNRKELKEALEEAERGPLPDEPEHKPFYERSGKIVACKKAIDNLASLPRPLAPPHVLRKLAQEAAEEPLPAIDFERIERGLP